jgi:hypothetical protein
MTCATLSTVRPFCAGRPDVLVLGAGGGFATLARGVGGLTTHSILLLLLLTILIIFILLNLILILHRHTMTTSAQHILYLPVMAVARVNLYVQSLVFLAGLAKVI